MAATPYEHAEQARLALRAIVAEHGPQVLSSPGALANLLSDLLPDSPRIARILVAAAQDQIADELREHTSVGMDTGTASRLAASSFAEATMFAPEACAWVVEVFALALGLISDAGAPVATMTPPVPTAVAGIPARSSSLPPTEPWPADGANSGEPEAAKAVLDGARLGAEPAGTQPDGSVQSTHTGAAPAPATDAGPIWRVVITADRAYFDAVVAERGQDAEPIEFPGTAPERGVDLSGTQMRIGRRSASRAIEPEIDLTGPPGDPGISHLHAVLIAQQDGTWSVLDTGSANGTQVNGHNIESGEPTPLRDGDSICLGAWTRLTIGRQCTSGGRHCGGSIARRSPC